MPPIKDDSGEDDSHGTANRSTTGDRPMEAPTGLEQADLMKALATDKLLIDPNAPNPASAGIVDGSDDPRQVASTAGVHTPEFVPQSDPRPTADADPNLPSGGPPVKPGPGNQPPSQNPSPKENHPAATGSTNPTPGAKQVATSDNKTPPRAVKGRLANASDTDSAPMQANGSFGFRSGRMVARQGLKVKYTQPRFGEAALADLASRVGTEAVFQVEVNADGTTNDVEPVKSSGSDFVDQDLKLCLYASTFSPEKDKAGHPKRTVWTIHILL
jgi:outer membrane biosynthesis protein TonB